MRANPAYELKAPELLVLACMLRACRIRSSPTSSDIGGIIAELSGIELARTSRVRGIAVTATLPKPMRAHSTSAGRVPMLETTLARPAMVHADPSRSGGVRAVGVWRSRAHAVAMSRTSGALRVSG